MEKATRIPVFIFLAAFVLGIACFIALGLRGDSERIAFPTNVGGTMGDVSFDVPLDSRVSIFICAPDEAKSALEAAQEWDVRTVGPDGFPVDVDRLTFTAPMPLDIPPAFAETHNVAEHVVCGDSEIVNLDEPDVEGMGRQSGQFSTRQLRLPRESFVVAAVSDAGGLLVEAGLFFAFLAALWAGFALLSRRFRLSNIRFRRYDCVLAFVLSNIVAYALLAAVSLFPFDGTTLLPGYGEMLAMLIANFAGFLLTAVFFVWLRYERKMPWIRTLSDRDPIAFRLRVPLLLGIGIAIVGSVFVLLLVEQPGLTTFTMASQLISTQYLTGLFALLAAISEESIFRGIIQSSLEARPETVRPRLTNAIAVAVASLMFVGMHVAQSIDHLWALVPIAAVSITSGVLKIRYQTIFPCILLHMTYNATLVVPGILLGL